MTDPTVALNDMADAANRAVGVFESRALRSAIAALRASGDLTEAARLEILIENAASEILAARQRHGFC